MMEIREEIFKFYFYFIQERMSVFWKKFNNEPYPWTNDKIIKNNKFTNVYRASDRVSQYLIKNVIYNKREFNEEDIILRVILFKIFNKIETWEYIEREIGLLTSKNFDIQKINKLLEARKREKPIFSNAYMMTGTHSRYNYLKYKHEKWIQMVADELMCPRKLNEIRYAKSLEGMYKSLRSISFIGDFLAYQYAIDLNYSPLFDFSENSFVKAGIGAIRGIKKCFNKLGKYKYEDAIRYVHDNFEKYQAYYGLTEFKNLFGRQPTLIDLQNCFCETDKYLREKIPELQVGNKRIKQKYKLSNSQIHYFFPPKWEINSNIKEPCIQQNTKVLTLF